MSLRVRTDFDSGNLGEIREVGADRVVARIHKDEDEHRACQQATWYAAKFDGTEGRPFEVVLTDLGGVYNGRPSHGIDERDAPRVSDDDGVTWRTLPTGAFDRDAKTFQIRLEPTGDSLWLSHLEPYVGTHLRRLADHLAGRPEVRLEVAGRSVEGRDIPFWTIGNEDAPHCVWLLARQHAWETHTSWCIDGALRWLASDEAATLRQRCVFKCLPLFDPDGIVHGRSRFNHYGYDVNRHWDQTEPGHPEHERYRPEICAGKRVLLDWVAQGRPVDLHLNLHDTHHDVYIAPTPCGDDPLLQGVYEQMGAHGFCGKCQVNDGGHPGVAQTALNAELGIPAALIELGTMELESYGRPPTWADRVQFGVDLAKSFEVLLPG